MMITYLNAYIDWITWLSYTLFANGRNICRSLREWYVAQYL